MASQPVLYLTPTKPYDSTYIKIPTYTALHSKWRILFNNIIKRKTLPMARDPTSTASLQTDPQHRGQNGFPNSIIIFKGNPTCGSQTHPWRATNQPIPNLGASQDGRSLTSNVTPTPYLHRHPYANTTQTRPLTTTITTDDIAFARRRIIRLVRVIFMACTDYFHDYFILFNSDCIWPKLSPVSINVSFFSCPGCMKITESISV